MAILEVILKSRRAEQQAKSLGTSVTTMGTRFDQAGRRVTKMDAKMTKLGGTATRLRSILGGAFLGLGAGFGAIAGVKLLVQYETTMLTLQGVTSATASEMDALGASARMMGATTIFSAKEAAEGLLFLARAGFTAEEAITALPDTLNLAIAGALGLGEAADFASNILSQFSLRAEEMSRVTDTLVATANSANTDVRQLAEAMKFAGPVAGALGVSIEETAAAIGTLGDSGIQASLAGTNMRGMFAALLGPTGSAKAAIRELGLTMDQLNPSVHSLSSIFLTLRNAGMGAEEALAIFGRRNVGGALILANSAEHVGELTAQIEAAGGTAARNAELIQSGLGGSFKSLLSIVQELVLQLGESGLGGALQSTVDFFTHVLRVVGGMEEAIKSAGTTVMVTANALEFMTKVGALFFVAKLSLAVKGLAVSFLGLGPAVVTAQVAVAGYATTATVAVGWTTRLAASVRMLTAAMAANPFLLAIIGAVALIELLEAMFPDVRQVTTGIEILTGTINSLAKSIQGLGELTTGGVAGNILGDPDKISESLGKQSQGIGVLIGALDELQRKRAAAVKEAGIDDPGGGTSLFIVKQDKDGNDITEGHVGSIKAKELLGGVGADAADILRNKTELGQVGGNTDISLDRAKELLEFAQKQLDLKKAEVDEQERLAVLTEKMLKARKTAIEGLGTFLGGLQEEAELATFTRKEREREVASREAIERSRATGIRDPAALAAIGAHASGLIAKIQEARKEDNALREQLRARGQFNQMLDGLTDEVKLLGLGNAERRRRQTLEQADKLIADGGLPKAARKDVIDALDLLEQREATLERLGRVGEGVTGGAAAITASSSFTGQGLRQSTAQVSAAQDTAASLRASLALTNAQNKILERIEENTRTREDSDANVEI